MILARSSFARGWMPDVDAVQAPPDALLRADNLVLDELGTLALRPGSTLLGTVGTDVHSLWTGYLGTTRYRMVGSAAAVYANGSSIATSVAGSDDISFGTQLGQIVFARSTTKKKYDGTTVRNWGVTTPAGTPTIAAIASPSLTFATCNNGEVPGFAAIEGTLAQADGQDGTALGSCEITPSATTRRGVIEKVFAAPTDFTAFSGPLVGTDHDLVRFYVYLTEPANLIDLTLMIDVNASSTNRFQDDYYAFTVRNAESIPLTAAEGARPRPTTAPVTGYAVRRAVPLHPFSHTPTPADPVSRLRPDAPVANAGWNLVQIPRGQFERIGATAGKDWSTVTALRVVVTTTTGDASSVVRIDDIRILTGALTGTYQWLVVGVYNSGTYQGRSGSSAISAAITLQIAKGATVTVPADAARDTQINELWLYRSGGVLDQFYRTAVKTGVSGVAAVTIDDVLSDEAALILNLPLQIDNAVPPSNIIGIEGPYYDRLFALTATDLYPSRRLNLDSFAAGQVIRIAGSEETALWLKKTFGGLYIGTTKDIYRLDGDGAELPDDTINFVKTPLNIDHPPVSAAVTQDGNTVIYLASDGWRTVAGAGSLSMVGATSLLYKGYTRHGISPVNVATGRLRAAVAKGQLAVVTPEGASTTSSAVLYRRVPNQGAVWYRHVYPYALRTVYREPDGTLLVGDASGGIYVLDLGTSDNGTAIAVVLWTKVDDGGQPFGRKEPIDLRVNGETGVDTGAVDVHRNGSNTSALTVALTQAAFGVQAFTLEEVAAFRQVQLRVTGSYGAFRFAGFALASGDIPVPFVGELPATHFGDPRLKTFSGFQFRLCTVGVARTLTPIIDGAAQTPLTVTTGVDEPENVTLAFATPVTGTEVVLAADGDVELYSWTPLISVHRPLGVKAWDSGPILFGERDLIWVRQLLVKVNAGADLTMTAYLDGRAFGPFTGIVTPDVDTVVPIDLGRGGAARVGRVVLTSTLPFYPFWIDVVRRVTGRATDKPTMRYPVAFDGGRPA